ncbi:hypothetical protein [Streptomyces regalis]|uniref:Uncharacterized protein n=1 Tax=Streptomyces regalis TaxID=68262 RepID=A0A0X3VGK1_9ACTN|nr:hypothetical protein [Streptomyces regalis]KUL43507.1 hypothetical protein ADL12_07935 [Streptomyces regalis]
MATGGWGPGPGSGPPGGQGPGGQGPGGQGWGAPYGPTPGAPYGPPAPNADPYPNQNPHPNPYPYPYPNPYPYGPPPAPPVPARRRRSRLWFFSAPYLAAAVIRSAHRVATRLFVQEGDGRIEDRTVDRVQVARTVLGAVATLALLLVYGVEKDRWEDAATNGIGNAIIAPVLLICAGPLVMLGFILYVPPHLRPQLRSRLRAPLKAVGWYLLTVVALGGIIYGASLAAQNDMRGWQGVLVGLVALVAIVWGLPFFFLASLYSARSAFNSAHVHPMLPPVVTVALVWVLAVFNLIDSGMPQGPPVVQFCSLLGGPLSVTAVSLWEMRRMRTRFGVTVCGTATAPGLR